MKSKISSIKETCLYVEDIDRSTEFYENILGFERISKVDDRHIFFRIGQNILLLFNPEVTKNENTLPPHFAKGPQHIAFEVAAEEYESIKKELGSKVHITHEQPWGKEFHSFYFDDPDGNVLEIVPAGMWDY